ncbi:hypothetical protein [Roseivirga sp. UBA838]|uniref:hypothetical protein n=1 Tax=Roseivirga sp. UBA838 TaxID=1947393 RepID=UPI00257DEFBB|nr:hypothetical protein [Roseivirga sp. UBA838]|tara:strand:- start:57633 stop:58697 length:1065 start_codon:yes stop_codon:yes gene_type:complete
MILREIGKLTISQIIEYCLGHVKPLVITVLIGGVIGVSISFLWPKEYMSKTTMVTTSNSSSFGGGIASLASITGFNLSTGSQSGISPNIYPLISKNVKFQIELLNMELDSTTGVTYKDHLESRRTNPFSWLKANTIGLYGRLKKESQDDKETFAKSSEDIDSSEPIKISYKIQDLLKIISNEVQVNWNDREQYIEIKVKDQNPIVAAAITKFTKDKLEQFLIKIETEKTLSFLEFINEEYQKKEKDYISAEEELSSFLDQNKSLSSNIAQLERRRLEQKSSLYYSVFQEVANQKAQAEIEYQKKLPIFTVIEDVKVPLDKVGPNRIYWFVSFGFLFGFIWLVLRLPILIRSSAD